MKPLVTGEYSKPGFWRSSFWNRSKVIYEIEVPSKFDLDIVTSGGSVEVENVNGEIKLKTSGGSLRLDELTGDIQARTSGGSVSAKNITGDAYLKTSGGSIKVMDCEGSIQCKTSGRIYKSRRDERRAGSTYIRGWNSAD